MRYVFDANLSPALPEILRALKIEAYGVFERFGEGAKDPDWLPKLDPLGDILVTYDKHIRTRPAEASALEQLGISALFFGPWWDGKQLWAQAQWLTMTWQHVHEQAQLLVPGSWVWVRANGDLAQESEYPKKVRLRRRQRVRRNSASP